MGCAASQPSEAIAPLDEPKVTAQPQAPSTKAPHDESTKVVAEAALPAAAVEPRHEAPVPAQVAESQAAAIAEASSQKKAAASTSPLSGSKKLPSSSRTTVVRPPWGSTPSAAAAVLRRKDAREGRLSSSPGVALKVSSGKPGSGGSTPRASRGSAPVSLADLGSAGAAALSSRRLAKAQEGTGSDGSNTPRYLQVTAAAAAKMSKTPKGPTSADKRQPWGMRKPTPIKRTLAFPGAALDDEPAAISVITATEEPSPPTVVLSSADGPLVQNGDAEEAPAKIDTPVEAEPAVIEAEVALEEADAAQPAAAEVPAVSPTEVSDITPTEAVDAENGGAEPLAAVEKTVEPQLDVPVEVATVPDAEPVSGPVAVESSEPADEVPATPLVA